MTVLTKDNLLFFLDKFKSAAKGCDSVREAVNSPEIQPLIKDATNFSTAGTSERLSELYRSLYPRWLAARYPEGGRQELDRIQMLKLGREFLGFNMGVEQIIQNFAIGERTDRWVCEDYDAFNTKFWSELFVAQEGAQVSIEVLILALERDQSCQAKFGVGF